MLRRSYLTKKVRVKNSPVSGKGVFAKEVINKDEIIAIWAGDIISAEQLMSLSRSKFKDILDYATPVAEGFYLVTNRNGRYLEDDDYFNHSCQPNAGIKGHLIMVAMRKILPGEEVVYDYAMTDAGFNSRFRCRCGKKGCRRIITSYDWKNPALQKKYRGYFSWFVQSKIDELKRKDHKRSCKT